MRCLCRRFCPLCRVFTPKRATQSKSESDSFDFMNSRTQAPLVYTSRWLFTFFMTFWGQCFFVHTHKRNLNFEVTAEYPATLTALLNIIKQNLEYYVTGSLTMLTSLPHTSFLNKKLQCMLSELFTFDSLRYRTIWSPNKKTVNLDLST